MTKLHWYLPLGENLSAALAHGEAFDSDRLCRHQAAALHYVLALTNAPAWSALALQRTFAKLHDGYTDALKAQLADSYTQSLLAEGLAQAAGRGIGLMDDDLIAKHPFLRNGKWDFDFAQRYQKTLRAIRFTHTRNKVIIHTSDHQLRVIQNIGANADESIEVQAHAGTGKTFVLKEVLALMPAGQCLLLADVSPKLEAVRKRFGDDVKTATFKQLAEYLLTAGNPLRKARLVAESRVHLDYAAVAELAGLGPIGNRNERQVAALCWKIIAAFCASADAEITLAHLPKNQLNWLSPHQRQLAILASQRLWFKMTVPETKSPLLPVRGYHRIKQMTLARLNVCDCIKTIIIDEGHDLSEAMVNYLNQLPQNVITLGDQYQNLDGRHVPPHAAIRYREMAISLRCGPSVVDSVNALIELFPDAGTQPFQADKSKQMAVREYRANGFPSEPAVILVADEWGLFDWLIRSRDMAKGAAVIDWDRSCELFLEGCLDLFLDDQPAAHGKIARFQTWAHLRETLVWNDAFLRVEQWLERVGTKYGVSGLYRRAELEEFAGQRPMRPLLATVFTAKNYELPNMALSEDLYYFAHLMGKTALSRKLALLYTAITRASAVVHFPDTHQARMDCIAKAATDSYRH